MEIAQFLIINFLVANVLFLGVWLYSLTSKDCSIVDAFWGFGHIAVAVAAFLQTPNGAEPRKVLLTGLVTLWALRLGFFILFRWLKKGPDRRYQALMGKAQRDRGWSFAKASLLMVFLTQAPLLWFNALPMQLGMLSPTPAELSIVAWIGAGIAVFGILFETIADNQMEKFKNDPVNQGKTMNTGLWRYSRHPNYFGEAVVWWGIFIVAIDSPIAWFGIPGVIFMTWTLVKWTGAATIEPRLTRTRPGYAEYVATTSVFMPWPPKRNVQVSGD